MSGRFDDGAGCWCLAEAGRCTVVLDGLDRRRRAVSYTVVELSAARVEGGRVPYDAAANDDP
ncbi:MAG TPA: hypothetical protein VHF25_09285, partial [Nitriliruptorales bacterium]|nr:hypothetical protein [Nitriliruptorales bacterium]